MSEVDPSSKIGKNAQIGNNVKIGAFNIMENDVIIGDGTVIGNHNVIANGTRIGKDCKIAHFTSLGGFPQDLKFKDEPTILIIGDRTDIREFATISRGTLDSGKTVIGEDCFVMISVHLAHDCVIGDKSILANNASVAGHVHLGKNAILGAHSMIHQFCHIGDYAMLQAIRGLGKDIPPFVLAGRQPVVFEGINHIGLRRNGFSKDDMKIIDDAYNIIYRSGLNVSQAVDRIKSEMPLNEHIKAILDFIENSKRGLIPAYSVSDEV
jgi:UDP-N-acetylglucosamine acyltransferase